MYVYRVLRGLKLLEEKPDPFTYEVDPVTAKDRTNVELVTSFDMGYSTHPNLRPEYLCDALYSYDKCFEYKLTYGDFLEWDAALARLVGYDQENEDNNAPGGPFYEILHRSFGCSPVGPAVAKKLIADFDAWEARAREFEDEPLFYLSFWWARCAFGHVLHDGLLYRDVNWRVP
ncbi:hypothetical protein [Cupriavidus campinensis]|uniref:hypothetical protein n=1 Tax=Cupriavidus campinensis TaxID=151783 RepID=UPI0024E2676A|nr:hypothetical protein [Cupriavidus campinensis]